MTATLVCSRPTSSTRSSNSSRPARNSRRQIKVSSRLAPQIYLGHISSNSNSSATATATGQTRSVVVKCAGQLRRCADGRLLGPWKEWQAASQLTRQRRRHPNVVQLFDAFVQQSRLVLVMEHCSGGDLLSHLMHTQPQSRLGQRRALAIVRDLAQGLRFLHRECNLAHRDVSLENVLVASDGRCKLGDFGLSTRADQRASGCVGKPPYAAPEVVAQQSYDPVAADVWSLGIVLFMLLTGAPLLQLASPSSPDFAEVKALGCRGVLQQWRLDAQLEPQTMNLLDEMLQFDPSERLQTMDSVLSHPALQQSEEEEEEEER